MSAFPRASTRGLRATGVCSRAGLCLLAAWTLALGGCSGSSQVPDGTETPDPGSSGSPQPLSPALAISPQVAAQGQELTAAVSAVAIGFDSQSTADLGPDVSVTRLTVDSDSHLTLELSVAADAVPGYRTLTVTGKIGTFALEKALLLQTGSIDALSPNVAIRGQTVDVSLTTTGVPMKAGYTWADFGPGTTTTAFNPIDPNHAVARVVVASDAPVGLRDVSVQNPPDQVTMRGGFTVDRGVIAIDFMPGSVTQGDSDVAFTITGYGTHFEPDKTTFDLGLGLLTFPDDSTATLTVESPTRITGTLNVCQQAIVGDHDLTVTTVQDAGPPEIVQKPAALNVKATGCPGVAHAYGGFYLGLSRVMRDGQITTGVSAFASFNAATSACGQSNGTYCSVQTLPYDQPAFYPPPGCTPTASTTQYPPTPSLDAGQHVYFDGPDGVTITLDRVIDTDGSIYYTNSLTIPEEQFQFDTAYDIRVDGVDDECGVPAFEQHEVLYTPPSDFEIIDPDLRFAPTLNRYDALPVTWQDSNGQPGADTFPVASMYTSLRTNDAVTGNASEIRVIPADDGSYTYPASYVSQLYPGSGRFTLQTSRLGTGFIIPGSSYLSTPSSSVSWLGYFELRDDTQ